MISLFSLWLPILLSAVVVFVLSSILHMVLTYHRSDFRGVPQEEEVMDALRPFNIPPGDYVIPYAASPKEMGSPEFIEKAKRGPVAMMIVMESGPPSMGKSLVQWFVYCLVVGIFAAYVAGRALGPGATGLAVLRFVGTTAFLGYALALLQNSIWHKLSWSTTLKSTFDGLLYALATATVFVLLWP